MREPSFRGPSSCTLLPLQQWNREFRADAHLATLADVAWNAGARVPLLRREALQAATERHRFSHELAPRMVASDQENTGRCWAFAGLAMLRRRLARTHRLSADFELSAAHLLFYDKLEKAHIFLRRIVALRGERWRTPEDRERRHLHLLAAPVPDGGTWDGFADLVAKYGVVPKTVMPESTPSANTFHMNELLRKVVRAAAWTLWQEGERREEDDDETVIREAMRVVHRILCVCIGVPKAPDEAFDWSGVVDDGDAATTTAQTTTTTTTQFFHRTTPLAFYREACGGKDDDDFVVLMHEPTKAPGAAYRVEYLQTVHGAAPRAYHNVRSAEELERAARAALDAGEAVWFACEFDAARLQYEGLLDDGLFEEGRLLDARTRAVDADKRKRIEARAINVDHAMLLTGYHADGKGTVARWQVENSHGVDELRDGYLSMSPTWFRRHVFVVAVHRRHAPRPLACEVQEVPPWDVIGFVAR
jgi:bleomycin hydrolase